MMDAQGKADGHGGERHCERGAGLVEYALLVALIALAALAGVEVFGGQVDTLLNRGGSSLVEAGR